MNLFWILFNTKGGHEGSAISIYDGCNENASASLHQIEYFPMDEKYNETRFYLFLKELVCAMVLTDRENGRFEDDQYYLDINGILTETWQKQLLENPSKTKEQLAINYLHSTKNSAIFNNYPEIQNAIQGMLQFTFTRWGFAPEQTYSKSAQREANPLNQALSSVARYNRLARKTFFLTPRISRRNARTIGIGLGLLTVALIVRKWRS